MIKIVIGIVGLIAVLLIVGLYWFLQPHPLPENVNKIHLVYQSTSASEELTDEVLDDLVSDDHSVDITDETELEKLRQLIGKTHIMPLNNDFVENDLWIMNIHWENQGYRLVLVDRNHIGGRYEPNSPLYQYLHHHYRQLLKQPNISSE